MRVIRTEPYALSTARAGGSALGFLLGLIEKKKKERAVSGIEQDVLLKLSGGSSGEDIMQFLGSGPGSEPYSEGMMGLLERVTGPLHPGAPHRGTVSTEDMGPIAQGIMREYMQQKLRDPLETRAKEAQIGAAEAAAAASKRGGYYGLKLIPGPEFYHRYDAEKDDWVETDIPVPKQIKGKYSPLRTAGPGDPSGLQPNTRYQIAPDGQVRVIQQPIEAKPKKPAERQKYWNPQTELEEYMEWDEVSEQWMPTGMPVSGPEKEEAPTTGGLRATEAAQLPEGDPRRDQLLGVAGEKGPKKKRLSMSEMGKIGDQIDDAIDLISFRDQAGPGAGKFMYGGPDYGQQQLLKVYADNAAMMGYEAMSSEQQDQFDAMWDRKMRKRTYVREKKVYEWNPLSAEVKQLRAEMRGEQEQGEEEYTDEQIDAAAEEAKKRLGPSATKEQLRAEVKRLLGEE